MPFKRVIAFFALIAGFLGVVASLVLTYPVWLVKSRLERTDARVFRTIDKGLTAVEARIRGVQKRIRDSKTNTTEIARNLRDWSTKRASERLVSAATIEERTEKLAGQLQIAEQWLESSMDSIRAIQQLLEVRAWAGAPVDRTSLDSVLLVLASIQRRLQEAEQAINRDDGLAVTRAGELVENRLPGVLKLLTSTELAADAIDTRLEDSVTRLSQMQADREKLQKRTDSLILLATGGCYVVLVWIAAGQAALCWCGWKNCFRSSLPAYQSHSP
jgi:hypothetical protein